MGFNIETNHRQRACHKCGRAILNEEQFIRAGRFKSWFNICIDCMIEITKIMTKRRDENEQSRR